MGIRMRNLPESLRHAPVNSVIRSSQLRPPRCGPPRQGREYAPHGALCSGAGQIGSNDLPPYAPWHPESKPAGERGGRCARKHVCSVRAQTGAPASGAGSRCASCVSGGSCADEDGSACVGSGGADGSGGVGVGSGSGVRDGCGGTGRSSGVGPAGPSGPAPSGDGRWSAAYRLRRQSPSSQAPT